MMLYFFILTLACFIAAMLGGAGDFYKMIITLCYVYIVLLSILNVFIQKFRFSSTFQRFSKVSFLILCFILTIYAMNISDEMLFKHELKCSPDSFSIRSVNIEAESGGYVIDIVFKVAYSDLINIVNGIGLYQVAPNEINPYTATSIPDIQEILIGQMSQDTNRVLFFSNINEKSCCRKKILYDMETGIAYYQNLNYN